MEEEEEEDEEDTIEAYAGKMVENQEKEEKVEMEEEEKVEMEEEKVEIEEEWTRMADGERSSQLTGLAVSRPAMVMGPWWTMRELRAS